MTREEKAAAKQVRRMVERVQGTLSGRAWRQAKKALQRRAKARETRPRPLEVTT